MLYTQSGRITLQRVGSPHEPNSAASVRRGDARDRNPSPSRTGTSMATVALYQGKGASKPRRAGTTLSPGPSPRPPSADPFCSSVPPSRMRLVIAPEPAWSRTPFGVPPMISTLRGLP